MRQFPDDVSWCSLDGTQPFVGPLVSPEMVVKNPSMGVPRNLRFRNPDTFQACSLHHFPAVWAGLFNETVNLRGVDLKAIINDGVKVHDFLVHFRGDFKGERFDSDFSPSVELENARNCADFHPFISTTILDWVASGVLSVLGEVGAVPPPHLVLLLWCRRVITPNVATTYRTATPPTRGKFSE